MDALYHRLANPFVPLLYQGIVSVASSQLEAAQFQIDTEKSHGTSADTPFAVGLAQGRGYSRDHRSQIAGSPLVLGSKEKAACLVIIVTETSRLRCPEQQAFT